MRSLSQIPGRGRHAIATALATLGATLALAASAAADEALPWGYACTPAQQGVERTSATCGATLVDGRAVAPPGAPTAVKQAIAAANHIAGRPYVWGGGHRSFFTHGYDCSGAVSYALHAGGLLDATMVSGQLAYWGDSGLGRWITVYANAEHVYMVIAGLRFDTRDDPPGVSGPRWHTEPVLSRGFAIRHPAGL